jgi:hypothetical protein
VLVLRGLNLTLDQIFQLSGYFLIEAMLLAELSDDLGDVLGFINHKFCGLLVGLADLDVGNKERLNLTDVLLYFFLGATSTSLSRKARIIVP